MFCDKCGKEIPDSSRFCSGCGNPVSRSDPGETVILRPSQIKTSDDKPYIASADAFDNSEEAVKKKKSPLPWILLGAGVIFIVILLITGITVLCYPKIRYSRQLSLGQRYLDELDYENAIAAYKAAIDMDPKNPDAYQALAEVYVAMEDRDAACAILQEGLKETGEQELKQLLAEINSTEEIITEEPASESVWEAEFNVVAANETGGIPEASIVITDGSSILLDDKTDSSGSLMAELTPGKTYTVECSAEGYYSRKKEISEGTDITIALVPELDNEDVCVLLDWNGSQNLNLCSFDSEIEEYVNIAHPMDSNGNFIYADNDSTKGYEMIYIRDINAERARSLYVTDINKGTSGMEADDVSVYVYTDDGMIWSSTADTDHNESLWAPMYIYAGDIYEVDQYISDFSDYAWLSFDPADQTPGLDKVWKEQYAYMVSKFENDHPSGNDWDKNTYKLIYLNDDNIPELIADHNGYFCEIYSIVNGNCEMVYDFGYGAFGMHGSTFVERTGYISSPDSDLAGSRVWEYYGYFDGKSVNNVIPSMKIDYFDDRNNDGWADEDEVDFDNPHYFVNDVEVSEEEFNSYLPDVDGEWQEMFGELLYDEMMDKLE